MTETTTSIDALYNRAAQAELRGEDFAIPAKLAMSLLEHVNALRHNLEAERQQREAAERKNALVAGGIDAALKLQARAEEAETELAELRGAQEPVGLIKRKTPLLSDGAFRYSFISDANLPLDTEIFSRQPKHVVVLPDGYKPCVQRGGQQSTNYRAMMTFGGEWLHRDAVVETLAASGIVVKDGE